MGKAVRKAKVDVRRGRRAGSAKVDVRPRRSAGSVATMVLLGVCGLGLVVLAVREIPSLIREIKIEMM